jgi:hypothetical protein
MSHPSPLSVSGNKSILFSIPVPDNDNSVTVVELF